MANIFMTTLGCPKNRVDAEIMLGYLVRDGHQVVAEPGEADVLVVNTCAFVEAAREESVDVILDAARLKEARPGARLFVSGCLPQRYREELAAELPEVDLFVGTGRLEALAEALREGAIAPVDRLAVGDPHFDLADDAPRLRSTAPYTAYVRIAEGCSRSCSFCAIPGIRGDQRSRAAAAIEAEVRALIAAGTVEVNLIAQDLTAWGDDRREGEDLAALLRRLARVPDLRWLRLLYGYPNRFPDHLLRVIAEEPAICKYVDVPVQHVDDRLLRAMRRGTSGAEVRSLVERLRAAIPGVVLRTSLIVGFPGEDDAAFERLRAFVAEARFERLGVFTYSREEGTAAAGLAGEVPAEVAEARREELMELQRRISREQNEALVGTVLPVLVEGLSDESDLLLQGRAVGQAPEVDGVTYLNEGTAQPGEIRDVEIVQAGDYDLVGRIL